MSDQVVRVTANRKLGPDPAEASRVHQALATLRVLEHQLRTRAEGWDNLDLGEQADVINESFDQLLLGLADTVDILQGLIKATVRGE